MSDELERIHHPADSNGDGKVSEEEQAMYLEFKRKELDQASKILGDMAATYFVSVAAIVAAFFGGQAYSASKK